MTNRDKLAAEEAKLEQLRDEYERVGDSVSTQYKRVEKIKTAMLAADELDWFEIVELSWNNRAASDVVRAELSAHSLSYSGLSDLCWYPGDDSDGFAGYRFGPKFAIGFKDTKKIDEIIDGLHWFDEKFSGRLALDDDGLIVDFIENGLSYHASYSMRWDATDDSAKVVSMRYHHQSDVFAGTLREVLTYISENLWYGEPRPGDDS